MKHFNLFASAKSGLYFLLFCQLIVSLFIICQFDGIGYEGDSVMHYMYAKYSFHHPELFFNHWAKPVYVLLASPFAQFGTNGIKWFNVLVMLLTAYFTFKTCAKLKFNNPLIGAVILIFSPLVFVLTFSGLTEPLFALVLIGSIYLLVSDKTVASSLLISFLPFVRTEGLFYLFIFAFYFLIAKKWKMLPLLLVGHVLYSIAGYFVYGNLLWVVNKIPYARFSSNYGSGKLMHFVDQMIYVVGVPIYILFWIGVLATIIHAVRRQINIKFAVFIFMGFFTFFIAHTVFWYYGIFNSMGLKRVLICVAPLSSIIALAGYNFLLGFFQKKKTLLLIITILLLSYIVVFPFTPNRAAINWQKDMSLSADQQLAKQAALLVKTKANSGARFFYTHPYLSESLMLDHFDTTKHLELNTFYKKHIQSGDIIIWENWFSIVECGLTKEMLDKDTSIINLHVLKAHDGNREVVYSIYQCK
ncbi:MAG: hypothetical protein IPO27_13075 [Bacteroidetes bacterium]|nr:hypothetical protein [Bacteroidota bacterium]